jgi:diguanylate cyclase (GGDEF)-like protein
VGRGGGPLVARNEGVADIVLRNNSPLHPPLSLAHVMASFNALRGKLIRLVRGCAAAALVLWWAGLGAAAVAAPVVQAAPETAVDLLAAGTLVQAARGDTFPEHARQIEPWLAEHAGAPHVNLLGGGYWLHARVRHDVRTTRWVLDPNNTLIEHVEARLWGSDGSMQGLRSGYTAEREYALHYGKDVTLLPGVTYDVLVRFDSRYFASVPRFQVLTKAAYQRKVLFENTVILGSLGAMLVLGLFNLFLYALARERAYLWYCAQLLLATVAWAMVFQLPAELLGLRELRLHYVPFFLLPAASSMFCIEFLELRKRLPTMYRLHRWLIVVSLLLAPLAVLALPWAHSVATLLISAWLLMTLTSAVRSWLGGYRPARFFVLAFVALLIPALVILPANLDLVPDLIENAELATLFGGAVEGLLQAFALADRIRLLNRERDSYAAQLGEALHVAHTDAMTGIANRYAFDLALKQRTRRPREGGVDTTLTATANAEAAVPLLLLVIDLDGLKKINDRHGHGRGDEFLKAVARGLRVLAGEAASCYRIGGDEFAILAPRRLEAQLQRGLAQLENQLLADGFEEAGISYGIAHWSDEAAVHDLVHQADQAMYQNKTRRKQQRSAGVAAA